jgi:adenosylcobinamide-phosphate guanylyltransferase
MDAVVMAGGMGKRLGIEEKPLTLIQNRPMISYVLEALLGSKNIGHIFVATSPRVEKTEMWLLDFVKNHKFVSIIRTKGDGFVNDMASSVEEAGITGSVLITMADLPLITSALIDRIINKYQDISTPALSVHMGLDAFIRLGLRPDTVFHKNGGFIVPCGINILDAQRIREEQEDHNLILDDEELALNVNSGEDLAVCERYLEGKNHLTHISRMIR